MTSFPLPSPTLAPTRARAVLLATAVFVFFLSAFVLTSSSDIFSTGDTAIRITVAQNLEKGSLSLSGWNLNYPNHLKTEYFDSRMSSGVGGVTYSTYLLGQPLAIIPLDEFAPIVARQERWPLGPTVDWIDRMVGPIFGALEVLVFFLFAVRLGFGVPRSLLLTGVLGFATSVWPDEQSVLEHGEVAFFLLLGTYLVFRFREQRAPPWYLLLAGAAVGGAMITRYQDAVLALVGIAVYLMLPSERGPRLVTRLGWLGLGAAGVAPFIALDLWYDWVRFGSVTATGHHERLLGNPILSGILGLTVSPGKGLLWYSPVILLLVFAGPRFYRRYRAFSIAIGAMAVLFIASYAYVTYWHGDPAWGPRYLYPLLPFLVLPLGTLFESFGRWTAAVRVVAVAVILGSLAIQVSAVSVSPWRTWYRLILYEEQHQHPWVWIAARYDYFWRPQESPLYLQLHGLYDMTYDTVLHSQRYAIVPPDEDPVLDNLTSEYSVNEWNFWWASNEFNWWMGQQKIVTICVGLLALLLASGAYMAAESAGVFDRTFERRSAPEPVPEAA